jgi:hypothetical protein
LKSPELAVAAVGRRTRALPGKWAAGAKMKIVAKAARRGGLMGLGSCLDYYLHLSRSPKELSEDLIYLRGR